MWTPHMRGIFLWVMLQKSWKKQLKAWRRKARASSGPRGSGASWRPHWPKMIACVLDMGRGASSMFTVKFTHARQKGWSFAHLIRCSMSSVADLQWRHEWSLSFGCRLRTLMARWTSLRHCFSSVASERSVPKDLKIMLKRIT